MAVFDLEQQKIYVRIVYDGAATAGKTTNIRQLCSVFSTARRSDLYTPSEVGGRTVLFDWVQISTGLACGFPLVCQVVAVPGQVVLEPRRTHLLRTADAIVYVSSSSKRALARSRRALEPLRRELASRAHPPPLVLQANKQDLGDAVPALDVRAALGIDDGTPVTAARAVEGVGVMETFVLTVRAIANHLQERSAREGMSVAVMPAETPEEVEAYLAAEDLPAGWETIVARGEPEDEIDAPRQTPESRAEAPALRVASLSSQVPAPAPSPPPPAILAPEPPTELSVHGAVRGAPLPSPNVPTGFIWPANFGRDVIRGLDYASLVVRDDLRNQTGLSDGSGKSDTIICRVGDHCMKTSERRRLPEIEAARASLVRAARTKIRLGDQVLPETVLVLQPDERGSHWLWTVTPWVTTLRSAMVEATAKEAEALLHAPLTAFASAAVHALFLAARQGIVLDVHPSNYGVREGRIFYLDDDVESGDSIPGIGFALLSRADEYAGYPDAIEAYVSALERACEERLTAEDVRKLGLRDALADAIVRTPGATAARDRLVACVDRAQR